MQLEVSDSQGSDCPWLSNGVPLPHTSLAPQKTQEAFIQMGISSSPLTPIPTLCFMCTELSGHQQVSMWPGHPDASRTALSCPALVSGWALTARDWTEGGASTCAWWRGRNSVGQERSGNHQGLSKILFLSFISHRMMLK